MDLFPNGRRLDNSVLNDVRKQHPDVIPYTQLPESEKTCDRIMAMNTLRLVSQHH